MEDQGTADPESAKNDQQRSPAKERVPVDGIAATVSSKTNIDLKGLSLDAIAFIDDEASGVTNDKQALVCVVTTSNMPLQCTFCYSFLIGSIHKGRSQNFAHI